MKPIFGKNDKKKKNNNAWKLGVFRQPPLRTFVRPVFQSFLRFWNGFL